MVDSHSKDLPQKPGQGRPAASPSPLIEAKTTCKQFLGKCFQAMFDVVDDTFFDLADKAENNRHQTAYFDAMRVIRLERKAIESQLFLAIDEKFSAITSPRNNLPVDDNEPGRDNLELVNEDHLEEIIALDTMVSKCLQNASPNIEEFNARLTTLMLLPVTARNNPFGPEVVCDIFGDSTKRLAMDIRCKLVFYKLFERFVLNALNDLYIQVNQRLDSLGVEQAKSDKEKKADRKPEAPSHQEEPNQEKYSREEQAAKPAMSPMKSMLVERLSRLVKKPAVSVTASKHRQAMATLDDIIGQISDIQEGLKETKSHLERINLSELLENQLSHLPSHPALGDEEKTVVELVDKLLDHFDATASIPNLVTPLIQTLKLPLLGLALQDGAVFDKEKHPARRLLNEIAQLSLQFDDGENSRDDPLFNMIAELVESISANVALNTQVITQIYADFLEKIGRYERRIGVLERRLMEELEAKDKLNEAHTAVTRAMSSLLEDKILPKALVDLAEQAWARVMFLTYLKQGPHADAWHEELDAITLLVEMAQVDDIEQERVVSLIEGIDEKMEQAAIDVHKRKRLLIRLKSAFSSKLAEMEDKVRVETFRADLPGEMLDDGSLEAEMDSKSLGKAMQLKKGAWVKLTTQGDQHKRCKLAGIISPSGKYVFVNRQGGREQELSRAKVALEIENNRLVILDNSNLVDRALDAVVNEFRRSSKAS